MKDIPGTITDRRTEALFGVPVVIDERIEVGKFEFLPGERVKPWPGYSGFPTQDLLYRPRPTDEGASLQLDSYQAGAEETAIFPRVWTEDQVKSLIWQAINAQNNENWQFAVEIDAWINNALDAAEQPFNKLVYPVLGLLGEAGEFANKLKKVARDGTRMDLAAIEDGEKELGDVMWYVAAVATGLGSKLGKIGRKNLLKLADRSRRGVLGGSGDNR